MIPEVEKDAKKRMAKSVEAFVQDLSKIRTGRANSSLLDHVTVSYYGSEVPLNQVASVGVGDAQTLAITPWEKKMIPEVEKAIRNADLGLNPVTSGDVVRVPLPPLTEERRKEMIRVVRQEAEQARVAIRNIRRDANGQIKALLKEKEITEDDDRRGEGNIQRLTDEFVEKVDELLKQKETDLLEV